MRKKSILFLILILLFFGVIYRIILTINGNFLFNIDNARDMIDVREMVVLRHLRLTGPTSGIEGFFDGPAWYYLLAIPFILTGGSPYSEVVLMILLWVIGGYFLLKTMSKFGLLVTITIGFIWISSNYLVLNSLYAFNPTPVTFLMPVFIYFLERALNKNKLVYSVIIWFLAGLFFNFEMAFGIFMPLIIILAFILSGNKNEVLNKNFLSGLFIFILTLLPQLLFDFKHQFIMTNSLLRHFASGAIDQSFKFRLEALFETYLNVIFATFMNWKYFVYLYLLGFIGFILYMKNYFFKDKLYLISLLLILVPLVGYICVNMNVMPWHLGGSMVALLILFGFLIHSIRRNLFLSPVAIIFCVIVIIYALNNLELSRNIFGNKNSNDPSNYQNEVAAIDYVYTQAKGQNFKVYNYLPSVIDYPYQYLFWWYGLNKYGYLPSEYAYAPNKPKYISNKELFNSNVNPVNSKLIFLIKEPNNDQLEDLWMNNFKKLQLIESRKVGPLTIDTRRDNS